MFQFVGPPVEIPKLEQINNDGPRYYSYDGRRYPSVTSVTGSLSREGIRKWRKRVGNEEANRVTKQSSSRGTRMHDIAERFLLGEDHTITKRGKRVAPDSLEMFNVIKKQLVDNVGDIYCLEERLFSDHLGLAGTVDCVGQWMGVKSVIDFKTSRKPKKREWIDNYFLQTCAYSIMWEELTGMPINRLVVLISVEPLPGDIPVRWTPNQKDVKVQVFGDNRDAWSEKLVNLIENYNNVSTNGSHEN